MYQYHLAVLYSCNLLPNNSTRHTPSRALIPPPGGAASMFYAVIVYHFQLLLLD